MKENISPEERLLKLIKGEKGLKASPVSTNQPVSSKIVFDKKANQALRSLSKDFMPKLSLVVIIISVLLLLAVFLYPLVGLNKIKIPKTDSVSLSKSGEEKVETKPYEFYAQGMKNGQIFGNIVAEEGISPAANIRGDFLKDINLIGIVSGDSPQAVIEDKKTQKTYYVSKGQSIGNFVVEDIQKGKIILSSDGQKFELYL